MKILVTGANGFVGQHLVERLKQKQHDIIAPSRNEIDIVNYKNVFKYIEQERPDIIFHLAAQSNVGESWIRPLDTVETNIIGTMNLYQAFACNQPKGKFINIGSSEIYGAMAKIEPVLKEDMLCNPQNPYAISKYAAEKILMQLAMKSQSKVISTRSFNHYGPGQERGFVISDFASQIAEIELGYHEPVLFVGNLSAKREFLYISDVIDAYIELIEQDVENGIYNVANGNDYYISDVLQELLCIAKMKIDVQVDQSRFRPIDVKAFCGNKDKLLRLGWKSKVRLKDGLRKTYEYWLRRCKNEHESSNCP